MAGAGHAGSPATGLPASGLRDGEDILWQFNSAGRNVIVDELVSLYGDMDDVNFAPGSHWNYNNVQASCLGVKSSPSTGKLPASISQAGGRIYGVEIPYGSTVGRTSMPQLATME